MNNLNEYTTVDLSTEELFNVAGGHSGQWSGNDIVFHGEWWCVFCWIDYGRQ